MIKNILEYLIQQANLNPDKCAVSDKDTSFTFKTLLQTSKSIGTYLLKYNLTGSAVVVEAEQSAKTLAMFFGVLFSGNYYVPVDCSIPLEKLDSVISSSNAKIILSDNGKLNHKACEKINFSVITKTKIDEAKLDNIIKSIGGNDPLYAVYTSGSTGIPKGVIKPHVSMISYVENFTSTFYITRDEVIANQTPFYFDASGKDIYLMLKTGATLHIVPKELFSFPVKLIEFLNEKKVTLISWVPSALSIVAQLNTFVAIKPITLKYVLFVGEVFLTKYLTVWQKNLPDVKFVNLYGSSECAGICCYHSINRIYDASEVLPIGKPLAGNEAILLNEAGKEVKKGEVGEICIISPQLALGYINEPEKTAEVFVKHSDGRRMYKTGDLAYLNDNNDLVFVSRKDFQIKHMGYRIELGEIEVAASTISDVQVAVCVYDQHKQKIIMFVVLNGNVDAPEILIKTKLKNLLPEYMIPAKIVILPEIPKNANGKTDRVALKNNYVGAK